ncbi:MAG: hypothetical protein ABIJ00_09555 [Candidatus Eisenbacteria bacterium]
MCVSIVLIAVASWQMCYGGPDTAVTDLWDMSHTLKSICNGRRTLIFLGDPGLITCREGAVYFDSKAGRVEARKIRPVCLFIGDPEAVRTYVLALHLEIPVYIDPEGRAYEALFNQKVLPAMALLDGEGNVVRTIHGGGQSLANNLEIILREQEAQKKEPGNDVLLTMIQSVIITVLLSLN